MGRRSASQTNGMDCRVHSNLLDFVLDFETFLDKKRNCADPIFDGNYCIRDQGRQRHENFVRLAIFGIDEEKFLRMKANEMKWGSVSLLRTCPHQV
jgi:hypothetical protein